jgi:hypothetical protein
MPTRMTRINVTASLLLALAAGVGLALWPCAYQGSRRNRPRTVREKSASCAPPSLR